MYSKNTISLLSPCKLQLREDASLEFEFRLTSRYLFLPHSDLVFVSWILVRTLWHFHYKKNPIPQKIVHGTTIEILWTIFPSIILMFIAILSFALLYSMDEVVVNPAITIKAIGYQLLKRRKVVLFILLPLRGRSRLCRLINRTIPCLIQRFLRNSMLYWVQNMVVTLPNEPVSVIVIKFV